MKKLKLSVETGQVQLQSAAGWTLLGPYDLAGQMVITNAYPGGVVVLAVRLSS